MAAAIAPYIVATLAGATGVALTAGTYYLAVATVTIGLSLALASALRPNLGDTSIDGQGQALKTRKDNTSAVPVVYGQNKIAGNIVWQTTNNYNGGDTNKDYWAIIAIADGELTDFKDVYSDENKMDMDTEDNYTLPYRHVYTYDTSDSGVNIKDITFITNEAGNTELGSTLFGSASVSTSSNSGDSAKLTDGNLDTSWTPASQANEWVKLVDNELTPMNSCRFYIPRIGYGPIYYTYKLQYSDNGTTWSDGSTLKSIMSSMLADYWETVTITESSSHTYWRLLFTVINRFESETYYNAPLYEVDYSTNISIAVSVPENIAYMAVHHKYDAENYNQMQNITAEVKGKVIDEFQSTSQTSLTPSYSANPARVVYDIMKESLNITLTDVDQTSFYNAQEHCENNDLECNIVFMEKGNTDSAIQAALATMRGYLAFSDNKWVLLYDAPSTSVKSLTRYDVISNSLSISNKPSADTANIVTVKYVNPDDEWQVAEATVQDDDLIAIDGQDIEQILELRGCTSQAQAEKLAQLTLNQMRYSENASGDRINQSPLDISFTTTVKNAELEVGDVFTLTHSLLSYARKFKIVSIETDQSGAIAIQAGEYCATHYKDSGGTSIIT